MRRWTFMMVLGILSSVGMTQAADPVIVTTSSATTSGTAATPSAGNVTIEKIAIGTGVESAELKGEGKDFNASDKRLYCWTKVHAQGVPTKIKHVWYVDGQKEVDVPLDVRVPTARTWSNKGIRPGKWKVDVTDDTGAVLASTEFTVK